MSSNHIQCRYRAGMTICIMTSLKTKHLQEKRKNKKKKIEEDVFAGKSAIYVKHFETKEI